MAANKIKALKLEETFQQLMKAGCVTSPKLTEALNQELERRGLPDRISRATVTRHLKKVKDVIGEDALKIIRDHIDRVVPEDLAALEEIESTCLDWFREPGDDRIKRLTEAALDIRGEIDKWINQLMAVAAIQGDEEKFKKAKRKLAGTMLAGAMSYLKNDAMMQGQRLAAAKMAQTVIESKLRNAGLLDDETKGRIVFLTRGDEDRDSLPGGGQKLFVIKRSKEAGHE